MQVRDRFRHFSNIVSHFMGSPQSFLFAVMFIVFWALSGPFFGFSNTWQLVINTATTIITFLMVFLIQNTQNRDSLAMQLKLDELIRSMHGARTQLVSIEAMSDEELELLHREFLALHTQYADALAKRRSQKKK